ncbi:dipeptide/oligopeptide/nickel ABC transporter permease/ATP-binding protein [Amycolatopsis acidiphila]|uniref:Dipeptide/oligopeptide/nickel ABC transporter permease/ATP-binding protein n=1 Tax=Amycolatopsis acidiphila TaxID=715473 RepID=A0A558A9H3_9PSEU|nr:dipeptide/oligopeptide/nickel ABC transporter permease/ATP-binding protein [Amycolatopsis acidiphila]TVT20918.1 dipeptide/oligopeptide/nickel ABC transporter permease/ATP-binding protein [Amycolatopsis acidiphila]UIJ62983.1 dipeptide/oligopeptide/nickel ABC transporter permease/ATP-binding protein [Amycolatopsis acidiphila]GHG65460.1 peptide ABC transporter ATP-binding protein [Amycolatopsis acidiphila]
MRGSRWSGVLRSPVGASAAAVLSGVLVLAVLAPVLWTGKANAVDTGRILQGSSAAHWMGTDSLGRDIFFRVLVATRLSVELALAATAIGVLAGLLLGTAPVLLGARAGRFVTAVVNIAVAFPGLLLALFFAVIFGVGTGGGVPAIGLATAPGFARLTQTLVATVSGLDFVAAARIAGVGRVRLLLRHVLPNVGEPLVVNATISAGSALLAFAGLSFLGLGVQAPDYDWGRLLGEGLNGLYIHPAAALAPTVAVVVAGLAFNLFGEAIAKGIGQRTPAVEAASFSPPATGTRAGLPADVVLAVDGLHVGFPGADGPVTPVRGVSFALRRGEAVGVVGESGSGKSLTALAVAQLIEEPGRVHADRLEFLGEPLLETGTRARRQLLGTSFAMVFQDPATSFNPTQRIGRQLAEVARRHQGMSRGQAFARAVDRLRAVRVPAAHRRARQFPHEFSGGMRQRAMIGMGVMGNPALIVADEPTTALDVTVQRQVLRLLQDVRAADDVAILLISHDITVVGQVCERVLVMYAGRIVEDLPAAELHTAARHPYTRALLAAVPDMTTDREQPLAVIPGKPADPSRPPRGCAFAPRCPFADAQCTSADPPLDADGDGRRVACWHAGELALRDTGRVAAGEQR